MIRNVADLIDTRYDKKNYCVEFPTVLDNIKSDDAKFEFVTSNTLQKVRLVRDHTRVKKSVAVIFVNTRAKDLEFEQYEEKAILYR